MSIILLQSINLSEFNTITIARFGLCVSLFFLSLSTLFSSQYFFLALGDEFVDTIFAGCEAINRELPDAWVLAHRLRAIRMTSSKCVNWPWTLQQSYLRIIELLLHFRNEMHNRLIRKIPEGFPNPVFSTKLQFFCGYFCTISFNSIYIIID